MPGESGTATAPTTATAATSRDDVFQPNECVTRRQDAVHETSTEHTSPTARRYGDADGPRHFPTTGSKESIRRRKPADTARPDAAAAAGNPEPDAAQHAVRSGISGSSRRRRTVSASHAVRHIAAAALPVRPLPTLQRARSRDPPADVRQADLCPLRGLPADL